jgi:hypothetical protein
MKPYIRDRIGKADALVAKYAEEGTHFALFRLPAALEFLEQLRGTGIGVLGADGWYLVEASTLDQAGRKIVSDPSLQRGFGGFHRLTPDGRCKLYLEDPAVQFYVGDDVKDSQSETQIAESIERTKRYIQSLPPDSVDFVEITLNIY